MKLLSWNVQAANGSRANRQIEALGEREPDLVALQEVRGKSAAVYQEGLARLGLIYRMTHRMWAKAAYVQPGAIDKQLGHAEAKSNGTT
jgi:exonuclease III